jgi:esterase/lipase
LSRSPTDLVIHPPTYEWSVRLFDLLRRVVRVNLELHDSFGHLAEGDIFLFNHFARFETFIPQYLVHTESRAYCRSVASGEFFYEADAFSAYLRRVGAVPNDLPGLLPFLAAEILRGRKVIIFPEGGMVKDRSVLDDSGGYSVYSRTAGARRQHHTGAAVLALALDTFKALVLDAQRRGRGAQVVAWAETLELEPDALLEACRRPTRIVPANITFYPIRVRDNLLRKGAELLSRGLSLRLSEELLIEGNILLRDTDMDIRLTHPVVTTRLWRWWDRALMRRVGRHASSLEALFDLRTERGPPSARLLARRVRSLANSVRDQYMHRMYTAVTVNLSHLASTLILALLERGEIEFELSRLRLALYLFVKQAQREPRIHLHHSLRVPHAYAGLPDGVCAGLDQLLETAAGMGLIALAGERLRLLPKLREEHAIDTVRLENLVLVYANEVAPIGGVRRALGRALAALDEADAQATARLRFDDHRISHAWDRHAFSGTAHAPLNALETATEAAEPFLLVPGHPRNVGVILAHGFLASPAEMRGLGETLFARRFPVIGVRLKGHGTSPWDLRERAWQDWLESVREGYETLRPFARRIALVGFSTGGGLCLRLAADAPEGLAGVVAVSVPMRFRNRAMALVPLVHGANRVVEWLSSIEGLMPFRPNASEHPHINYRHMPVRALHELRRLVDELEATLGRVRCPVVLMQGSEDPVVRPESLEEIRSRLGSQDVVVRMIHSERHGIVYQDVGETHAGIVQFLERLDVEA